ncbi:MAG: molecular chaperone DnaJ [Candidatus Diapherotrites archaeon]|nr:molecular chaperone DnaJ [Candidatus Diapherotrites archaeon]
MPEDYYKILGVEKGATPEEIKKKYRTLARKYHPDVNPNDKTAEAKFKEINEAFEVLGNPQKRANYDQFGQAGPGMGRGGFGGFGGFNQADFSQFDDLFSGFGDIFNVFSGGRRRHGPQSGADLRYDLTIELEESFSGIKSKIELPRTETCGRCNGNGAEPGTSLKTCPDCNGTGEVKQTRRTPLGQFVHITMCHKCNGSGKIIENPCSECHGEGTVRKTRTIEINIPKGVDNDSHLKISGEGEAGTRGGPSGDLYIVIHVKPHKTFERYGKNLYCKRTISLSQAVLGSEIEVDTIEGKAKLKIPSGTQSHTVFKMRGQGMPDLHNGKRGDQLVKIEVLIPTKLNKKQKEMFEEFSKDKTDPVQDTKKGFFEKLKKIYQ